LAGLIILGSLLGVVWIVQALRQVDVIASNGQSILTYLSITTLAVPGLILSIIPIALLLATIHTINTLNANSELVVVSASGFSNLTIAKPLIILALICSLVAGIVGHILTPISLGKLRDAVTEMRADLISIIIREGTFNSIEKDLTFHIGARDAGGVLKNILISDDREESTSIIYSAKEGFVVKRGDGSYLLLKDGEIHQKDRNDNSVTVVKYQSYLFDISSFSGSSQAKPIKPKERTTFELFNPDPNDIVYKSTPLRFANRIHERFSEMLWPFAYVFVVLAFAGQARSSRQSFASSIFAAFVVVTVARIFGFSAVSALKSDTASVLSAYLYPLGCIVFGAWFVFTNRPVSLPKPMADKVEDFNGKIANKFEDYQRLYLQYRRRRAGVET